MSQGENDPKMIVVKLTSQDVFRTVASRLLEIIDPRSGRTPKPSQASFSTSPHTPIDLAG